jgi:hypothetical protein
MGAGCSGGMGGFEGYPDLMSDRLGIASRARSAPESTTDPLSPAMQAQDRRLFGQHRLNFRVEPGTAVFLTAEDPAEGSLDGKLNEGNTDSAALI